MQSRHNQNVKKIKLTMISQFYFILDNKLAKNNETEILEYLRKFSNFENIIEKGQKTERFYCNLDTFTKFENNIFEFKNQILDKQIKSWDDFRDKNKNKFN